MSITVFDDLRKEFSTRDDGISYVTKRGLARLCGVKHTSWKQNNYLFNKELDDFILEELEFCSGSQKDDYTRDFLFNALTDKGLIVVAKSSQMLQDILASLIIEFYANIKKTPEAKANNRALRAVGLRTVIQKTLNWQPSNKKDYSGFLLKEPRVWSKIFEDDIYDEFARLTGLTWDRKTHQKPCYFAKLTYALVYSYLPPEVYKTIKETQETHGGYIHRLHEFLTPDGLECLKTHLTLVSNIMSGSGTIYEAKRLIHQAITGEYQLSLFGR